MKKDGFRIDRVDTKQTARIAAMLNRGWLQTYGKNSIMFTEDFLRDVFHPLFFEEHLSAGIYDAGGEICGMSCAFKVPVYYRKLGRTYESVYGSLVVIDEQYRNSGLVWELVKPMLELKRFGYIQYVGLAMPKAVPTFMSSSDSMNAFLETINFHYAPASSFFVRILVNSVFENVSIDENMLSGLEIGPVEENRFSEYIDFLNRKKLEVDAFSDFPEDVWRHMFFGMRKKRAWHCYRDGELIAVLFVNVHRTMASEVPNGYIEIYAQDALDGEVFSSLTYKFIKMLRDSLGMNGVLIQNPTFYNDTFLSQLKTLGFGQTQTKHTFHIFSVRDKHLSPMTEAASWIFPVF